MFFKEVVKAVLIFGSEIWVMTPPLNGMGPGGVSVQGGQKDYRETDLAYFRQKMVVTPLDLTMQKLGFEEVEAYAPRR